VLYYSDLNLSATVRIRFAIYVVYSLNPLKKTLKNFKTILIELVAVFRKNELKRKENKNAKSNHHKIDSLNKNL
jgi:hypothetical protein